MAPIDIAGLHRQTSKKGDVYIYAWRGGPRLFAEPGSEAFVEELAAARQSRKSGGDPGRIAGLITRYKASDDWKVDVSAKTKASWAPWLDKIHDKFGKLSIAQFNRPQIRPDIIAWHKSFRATPRAADMGKQVLSRLMTFARDEGRIGHNPCEDIENLYSSDRADLIWTPDDMAELARHASPDVLLAARLASLTGLRQSDLLRLGRGHIKPNSIEITTGKSGHRKTTLIPIYGELRQLLGEITEHQRAKREAAVRNHRRGKRKLPPAPTTLLTNSDGRPWSGGFGASWTATLKGPDGKTPWTDLHFHDLRGTAATRMRLGGLTRAEVAEVFTWSEDRVEALERKYIMKNALLLDRIRRMDEAAARALGDQA